MTRNRPASPTRQAGRHRHDRPAAPASDDASGRGYDSGNTRDLLEILDYRAEIAVKGQPAPIQAGKRRPIKRTHA
jgi:hypothetical protein